MHKFTLWIGNTVFTSVCCWQSCNKSTLHFISTLRLRLLCVSYPATSGTWSCPAPRPIQATVCWRLAIQWVTAMEVSHFHLFSCQLFLLPWKRPVVVPDRALQLYHSGCQTHLAKPPTQFSPFCNQSAALLDRRGLHVRTAPGGSKWETNKKELKVAAAKEVCLHPLA